MSRRCRRALLRFNGLLGKRRVYLFVRDEIFTAYDQNVAYDVCFYRFLRPVAKDYTYGIFVKLRYAHLLRDEIFIREATAV